MAKKGRTRAQAIQSALALRRNEIVAHQRVEHTPKLTPTEMLERYSTKKPSRRLP